MRLSKAEAQRQLDEYLIENDLVELSQEDLDEWYRETLKGCSPPCEIELKGWEDRIHFLEKDCYVSPIKGGEFGDDEFARLIRVAFAVWDGQEIPTIEVEDNP